MTTSYHPDSATYAWSESDRHYGRSYVAPAARPGWHDGYGPMDRPNFMATPGPGVAASNSTALRKGAMAAALLTAVVGGALVGTFVLGNSTSAPSPSVYMVPETSGPAVAPAPVAAPPAPSGPTTVVVPGRAPAPTVIVPPARRGPAPAFVPVPAPMPPAPRPAIAPPPPPPPPAPAAPQIRIEGIPIPVPMPPTPAQPPANEGENNKDQQLPPPGQGQDECTTVPDLPYCNKGGTPPSGGNPPGGTSPGNPGTGGFDPSKQKGETRPGDDEVSFPGAKGQAPIDPDQFNPHICIQGMCT
jgi:hypothetical protein